MTNLDILAEKVMEGHLLTRREAMELSGCSLEPLCRKADEIRRHFCSGRFDLCTIVTEKADAARKTAVSAPSLPTATQMRPYILCSRRKNFWRTRPAAPDRAYTAIHRHLRPAAERSGNRTAVPGHPQNP